MLASTVFDQRIQRVVLTALVAVFLTLWLDRRHVVFSDSDSSTLTPKFREAHKVPGCFHTLALPLTCKVNTLASKRKQARTTCLTPLISDLSDTQNSLRHAVARSRANEALSPSCRMFVLVMGMATEESQARRNTMRSTWIADTKKSLPHPSQICWKFFIGTKNITNAQARDLHQEQARYKDMVFLEGVWDAYHLLARKLLVTLAWITKYGQWLDYVLKVDDDTYVRVDALFRAISSIERSYKTRMGGPAMVRRQLYWGFFTGHNTPKFRGKWKEKGWFSCDRYLPYAVGGGYVVALPLVRAIGAHPELYRPYRSEDVSLGLWLAPFKKIIHHDHRFNTEAKSRGCFNDDLVIHRTTKGMMQEMSYNIQTYGVHCHEEERLEEAYEFDVSLPPSACCLGPDIVGTNGTGRFGCVCSEDICNEGTGQCVVEDTWRCVPYHTRHNDRNWTWRLNACGPAFKDCCGDFDWSKQDEDDQSMLEVQGYNDTERLVIFRK